MKILGFEFKRVRQVPSKDDFIDEKRQIRIDHEKEVLNERLKTIKKQEELDRSILDYKIREQQCKIDEDFSNFPEEIEEVIEEQAEDVPEWLKPLIPVIVKQFTANNPGSNMSPLTTNNLSNTANSEPGLSLSDEELKIIKQQTPKADIETLKGLPDAQCKAIIRQRFPKITEETLERAIKILKS